jgi:hypothetical protein
MPGGTSELQSIRSRLVFSDSACCLQIAADDGQNPKLIHFSFLFAD